MLFSNMRSSLVVALLGAAFFGAGCQPAHVRTPLATGWSDNDAHARSEFWYELVNRPVAGNDETFHGLLLYLDGTDPCADYPARVNELKRRKMLAAGFHEGPAVAADRGTLAVALVKVLKIDGGLTMHVLGPSPRYAVRALEYRGVYPPSSPNQGISGAQLVGIMQKAEEFERGSPGDAPAAQLPSEIRHPGGPLALANPQPLPAVANSQPIRASAIPMYLDIEANADGALIHPFFLADATQPAADAGGAGPKKLKVIVTGVEGDLAEVRKNEITPWIKAAVGMILRESAEFRTGPKSSIRFIIPPDQTFAIDSQGTIKLLAAVGDAKREKTDIGLSHGRVRYDVDKNAPVRIEQAGIEHDASIRSPNSALALRGTKVSLFEQSGFDPEAISLTGRAIYINTRGIRVPFGGIRRAAVNGAQLSAAQQAADRAEALQSPNLARNDFATREISLVIQRGGFISGDVIVGDLHLSDFSKLPGALDFVLQWSGGPQKKLEDLNLAVFSPNYPKNPQDFVANPPFTVSLDPKNPASIATRAKSYPESSPDGGSISKNSVGPDGLELASWPKNYPVGTYGVVVFNFLDAFPPPKQTTDPVAYTITVKLNNQTIATYAGSVGFLQTSPLITVPVPASLTPMAISSPRKPIAMVNLRHAGR
jgi:hypothetical protein